MLNNDIKKFMKCQLDFFMRNLVDNNNMIIPDKYNIISKKPASNENMVNDLGDYIQYLYGADILTGGEYSNEISEILQWTFNKKSYKNFLKLKKLFLDSTIDTGDFLVGLNTMLHSDIDNTLKNSITFTIDKYLEEFYPNNLKNFYSLSYKGVNVPIIYWYSMYNDVEELIYIYEYTNNIKYLNIAKKIYDFATTYKINNIPTIASFKYRWLNDLLSKTNMNIYNTVLSKTMSNYSSATIKLSKYDSSINVQDSVLTPLIDNFFDSKYKRFSTIGKQFKFIDYNLAQNHPAISLFVDYNINSDFDYLSIIDSIIDESIDYPYNFFHKKSFHVDGIVDFCTILIKLYEKTKNDKYLEYAQKYMKYIIENCKTDFGLFIQGESNYIQTSYSTKFQSLVLKPYILLAHMQDGRSIFNDKFLYLLSRDR